ncbi:ornithine decarboxylase [Lentzea sp. NBRC 105346]|uniref:aminotransferase class I/II-fold pyridoxal phosphate-dependent enzyme n=1 Tax=Lentzea sp. NBRC 105346 TaxID=3032205 RepID=UPI0024A4765F|nr:ornithine decarboxylase [Lentzea sp. NBRC 105346]GLZ28454.1 ornithine decarboxylase [Lentzea sp. NBRC 105346]
MDHSRAPVLEAIENFRRRGHLPFIPPGHKQGRGVDQRVLDVLGPDVFASDIIVLNGLDDREMSNEVISNAEDLMADAVGADRAYFSTCGSSLSVKSCIITVARPGERLLVSRNAHKSVVAGLIISGVHPVWVHPRWDPEWEWAYPPGPDEVVTACERAPDTRGLLLITPTDYGTCADIAAIADVCHERDKTLIVDEAWGAHLPFHDGLPAWAMDAGADLCVTSVHKMGAGIEQSSVYHLQGDRVAPEVLAMRADLLNTTSPSALVYACLDGWRRQMYEHGHELLDRAIDLVHETRARLGPLVRVVSREDVVGDGKAFDHDPLKIVMDVRELGISGYTAAEWLRDNQRVDVGLSDHRRIAAQITIADDDETVSRLVDAIAALAKEAENLPRARHVEIPDPGELELDQAMPPRDAFFALAEHVDAADAVGRICAETISPYPPGVPAALPGEVITQPVIDYLRSGREAGMYIPDPTDVDVQKIRVVKR